MYAKQIVDNTTRSIGLIFYAVGNTSIRDWNPQIKDDESLYKTMMRRIHAGGGNLRGILWFQGENDASMAWEATYEQALLGLVDAIRLDTGRPELPFLCVQLSRFYSMGAFPQSWEVIRDAPRRAALQRTNIFMVSALDVLLTDQVHISAESQQRWARRLVEVALSEVYHQPGHGKAIGLESIKVVNRQSTMPSIRLHFSGVSGRLMAEGRLADFELRTENPTPLSPVIFRTDFDPEDPAGLILRVANPLTQPAKLVYGSGAHPYCNIVDEKDMAVPAFGPIDLP